MAARTANSPSARKAKGRRAAQEIRELLLRYGARYGLGPDDINVVPSGVPGEDLWFSPAARRVFPFVVESKCQEALNHWAAIKQSEGHAEGTPHIPLLVFKRNNQKLRVTLCFEAFLKLLHEEKL